MHNDGTCFTNYVAFSLNMHFNLLVMSKLANPKLSLSIVKLPSEFKSANNENSIVIYLSTFFTKAL